jgi:uncharacterized protein DUF397
MEGWRTSSFSEGSSNCVQVRRRKNGGEVRDSKHPDGPTLHVDLDVLIATVRHGPASNG